MNDIYNLGIDIGGTKCAAVLGYNDSSVPAEKTVLDKVSFQTNSERGWQAVTGELLCCAEDVLKRNNVTKLHAVGISCGGPLDSKKGIVCCPPNLPDWDNVPIKAMFENRFHAQTRLQNDANACAVAEWKFGAGRGFNNLVFLTFGTGMGAGLILDGKLYSGACDMAGEVGHIRLSDNGPEGYSKNGSFEGFCSGGGIVRLAKLMAMESKISSPIIDSIATASAKSIALAAYDGDEFAKEVYLCCAKKLGAGLSIIIDLLNPEAIIIGSIYQRSRSLFDDTVNAVIKKEALTLSAQQCQILPAALGDSIGDFAALSLAMD